MKLKAIISLILIFTFTLVPIRASGIDYDRAVETLSLTGTSAESCVLYCLDTNEVVYASNEAKRLPMASTTKIMTAIVVLENSDVNGMITVPQSATGVEGSSAYLMKGESISIKDLLYALMLESANDAAMALAISVGGDAESFVAMMNAKAADIGMKDTCFANPHGLDDEDHYSTAYDMALLCDYAMDNTDFTDIVGSYRYQTHNRLFVNHNRLLKTCEGVIGGKTGFTKRSGRCLVSVARRDGVTLCAVTLNDPDDWKDHKSLYDAGFDIYESVTLKGGEYNIPVINSDVDIVTVTAPDTTFVCKKGSAEDVVIRVCHDRFIYSPVKKGDGLGYILYTVDGKELARTELIAQSDISQLKRKTFIERIISFLFQD